MVDARDVALALIHAAERGESEGALSGGRKAYLHASAGADVRQNRQCQNANSRFTHPAVVRAGDNAGSLFPPQRQAYPAESGDSKVDEASRPVPLQFG